MVGVDLDCMLGALHIDSPVFEAFYHRQKFFVIDGVVQFGSREFSGVVADGVDLPLGGSLRQEASQGKI